MANAFDQFDEPAQGGGNPFDQFDGTPEAQPVRSFVRGAARGVSDLASLADTVADKAIPGLGTAKNIVRQGASALGYGDPFKDSGEQVRKGINALAGDNFAYDAREDLPPEDRPYAVAGEVVGASVPLLPLGPGGALAKSASIAGSAIGAGGAERALPGNEAAQVAAGVVGGLAPALGSSLAQGGRASLRMGASRQKIAQTIDDLAPFDASPSAGLASGGRGAAATEAALGRLPFSSGVLMRNAERTLTRISGAIERKANELAKGTPVEAPSIGDMAAEGIKNYSRKFGDVAAKKYARVEKLIPPDTEIAIPSTQARVQEFLKGTGDPEFDELLKNPALERLRTIAAKDTTTFQALQKFRSEIGQSLNSGDLRSSGIHGKMDSLYQALSDDLNNAAEGLSPAAQRAFKEANRFYRDGSQKIQKVLNPLIKNKVDYQIYDGIDRLSREGPTKLRSVYRALSKEQRDAVSALSMKRLGRAKPGQQNAEGDAFSLETFLTNWDKLVQSKTDAVMFNPKLRKELQGLARVAENARAAKTFSNPSGTGQAVIGPAIAVAFFNNPIVTAVGMISADQTARLMTNPRFVRWLAQSGKTRGVSGAQVGQLGSIAANSDPETAQAIREYLTVFVAGQGQVPDQQQGADDAGNGVNRSPGQ